MSAGENSNPHLMARCAVALATALVLTGAAAASGAVGELTYRDCITGETESGGAAAAKRGDTPSGACTAIPRAISSGAPEFTSGLDAARAVAVSRDGRSVYVSASADDAIARFTLQSDGDLVYNDCVSGEAQYVPPAPAPAKRGTAAPACVLIPGATPEGVDSGLDDVRGLVVSGDGKSLYAVSNGDDAVARFRRDRLSGELTYRGCITAETETADAPDCVATPKASAAGLASGLNGAGEIALRPGGESLYVGSTADDAVSWFARNPKSGALTFKRCLTSSNLVGPAGSDACAEIGGNGEVGGGTMAPSADGKSLYSVSNTDLARFRLKPSGRPVWQDCLSGELSFCREIPSATANGNDSGFDNLSGLVVSPDDKWVYAAGEDENAIARLRRNRDTGRLGYKDCLTATTETGPVAGGGSGACAALPTIAPQGEDSGFDELERLAISRDGRSVYTTASVDASVGWLSRSRRSGKLTFRNCFTGDTDAGPAPTGSGACTAIPSATDGSNDSGLDSARGVSVSGDGKWLYATSTSDDALARFRRER